MTAVALLLEQQFHPRRRQQREQAHSASSATASAELRRVSDSDS
jgi:hypothetical protein